MTTSTTSINHRQTFGNGAPGEKLSDITRHLVSDDAKVGMCGVTADKYASYRYYAVATRIENAPICQDCLDARTTIEWQHADLDLRPHPPVE